jgi:hypothetical protein
MAECGQGRSRIQAIQNNSAARLPGLPWYSNAVFAVDRLITIEYVFSAFIHQMNISHYSGNDPLMLKSATLYSY